MQYSQEMKLKTKMSYYFFEDHTKASQTLNGLARNVPYMCLRKRKAVIKAFATSQLEYRLLV